MVAEGVIRPVRPNTNTEFDSDAPVVEIYEEKKEAPIPTRKDIEELFASITQINKIN